MPAAGALHDALDSRKATKALELLYGGKPGAVERARGRCRRLIERFTSTFPADREVQIFSAPGRTEVGGNHTDHNAGRVLAAGIDLDILAAASPTDDGLIVIESEGYPRQEIRVADLARRESERSTASALTRGIAARMKEQGHAIGGFHACVASEVPKGAGLSSSAAYEVLVATILNHFCNGGRIDGLDLALISQFSENEYFGKPCGLMDQTTCARGGFVTIDFEDPTRPRVRSVRSDFRASGYSLVIVDTGGSHADLTDDYAAIKEEMKGVARAFGGNLLREFSRQRVIDELPRLRGVVSDRAILRALHFYDDDLRVVREVEALESGRLGEFLDLVIESGRSSWTLLQNCYSHRAVGQQGVPIALAVSEILLRGAGAWRVHGGGFAGTIQAFVANGRLEAYLAGMRTIFGPSSCHELSIRPVGALRLDLGPG